MTGNDEREEDLDALLAIRLLGGFQVRIGSRELPDRVWRLSKARSLLKLLALSPSHRLARDQVVDLLWPDLSPDAAANNLHQTLHGVRHALRTPEGTGELRLQHGLLSLQPDGGLWVDVDAFELAASTARRSDDPALYHAALGLYAGDLLPDDLYDDWATWRREGLHQTYLQLLLGVARRHEARGELKQAMQALHQATQCEPTLEESHVALMRLYAATGQRRQALRQYTLLQEVLAAELDAEPDESSRQMHAVILASGSAAPDAAMTDGDRTVRMHNLPVPLSSFVGRAEEMAEFADLLSGTRLLTLAGVGGAGKTRLAVRLGRNLLDSYPDGVWMVRLDSLGDPNLVPATVARVLEVEEPSGGNWNDALIEHLRGRDTLLILNNCEHLLDACSRLTVTLLQACAGLQILATSRARLGVTGEVTAVVPPLSIPETGSASVEKLAESEAVRLFIERARFRRPSFSLTERTAQAVARICREVKGIPLAIELAAGRMGALSVGQIADRLADAPGLLTSGDTGDARHQTLRAALDWSYELLDDEEQRLFRRLAVFDGGWVLERLEALSEEHDASHLLDLLTRLVDKSLVVVQGAADEGVRYRLLEPVRQYACDRLVEAGEVEEMRRRHLDLYVALAESTEDEFDRPDARRRLDELEEEHNNIRAALRWSLEQHRPEAGLHIACSIWRFWYQRGHLHEGRQYLAAMLDAAPDAPVGDRANALRASGILASVAGAYEQSAQLLEQALALNRSLERQRDIALCLNSLGIIACEKGKVDQAIILLEEGLAIRRQLGGTLDIAASLLNIGFAVHSLGDWARSQQLHEEALTLGRAIDSTSLVSLALHNLGHIAVLRREYDRAVPLLREALVLTRDGGESRRIASTLEAMAGAELEAGDLTRAARLGGAATAIRETVGAPMQPNELPDWERTMVDLRASMDATALSLAWAEGQALDLDAAIAYALAID